MADFNKRPGCDDDCEGERGERGKRGRRGPTGPAGSASGGLLKFSGIGFIEGAAFLEDFNGDGLIATVLRPRYPVAIDHSLRNMATNIGTFVVPDPGTITFDLLKNGVVVPGFTITYGPGETGVKSVAAGPELFLGFPTPDTFEVRVTLDGSIDEEVPVSATIGVE